MQPVALGGLRDQEVRVTGTRRFESGPREVRARRQPGLRFLQARQDSYSIPHPGVTGGWARSAALWTNGVESMISTGFKCT